MIVIQSALYGVLEEGKCEQRDYGYVGCHVDQIWYLDQRCSGRQICKVLVGSKELKERLTIPCPEAYLDVTFICQKGKLINMLKKLRFIILLPVLFDTEGHVMTRPSLPKS